MFHSACQNLGMFPDTGQAPAQSMRLHEVKELFQIVEKKKLNDAVVMVRIAAPLIAKKVLPGQFIIVKMDEKGERIPLTICDYDREEGTITADRSRL